MQGALAGVGREEIVNFFSERQLFKDSYGKLPKRRLIDSYAFFLVVSHV